MSKRGLNETDEPDQPEQSPLQRSVTIDSIMQMVTPNIKLLYEALLHCIETNFTISDETINNPGQSTTRKIILTPKDDTEINHENDDRPKIIYYIGKPDEDEIASVDEKLEATDNTLTAKFRNIIESKNNIIQNVTLGWINGNPKYPKIASLLLVFFLCDLILNKSNLQILQLDNDSGKNDYYIIRLGTIQLLEDDGSKRDSQEMALYDSDSYKLSLISTNIKFLREADNTYTHCVRDYLNGKNSEITKATKTDATKILISNIDNAVRRSQRLIEKQQQPQKLSRIGGKRNRKSTKKYNHISKQRRRRRTRQTKHSYNYSYRKNRRKTKRNKNHRIR